MKFALFVLILSCALAACDGRARPSAQQGADYRELVALRSQASTLVLAGRLNRHDDAELDRQLDRARALIEGKRLGQAGIVLRGVKHALESHQ